MNSPKREGGGGFRKIKFIPKPKHKTTNEEDDDEDEVLNEKLKIKSQSKKKPSSKSSGKKSPSSKKPPGSGKEKRSKKSKKKRRSQSLPRTSLEIDLVCAQAAAKVAFALEDDDSEESDFIYPQDDDGSSASSSSSSSSSSSKKAPLKRIKLPTIPTRGRSRATERRPQQEKEGVLSRLTRSLSPGTKRRARRGAGAKDKPRTLRRKEKNPKKKETFLKKIEKYGIEYFEEKELTPSEEAIFWKIQGNMKDITGEDEGDY